MNPLAHVQFSAVHVGHICVLVSVAFVGEGVEPNHLTVWMKLISSVKLTGNSRLSVEQKKKEEEWKYLKIIGLCSYILIVLHLCLFWNSFLDFTVLRIKSELPDAINLLEAWHVYIIPFSAPHTTLLSSCIRSSGPSGDSRIFKKIYWPLACISFFLFLLFLLSSLLSFFTFFLPFPSISLDHLLLTNIFWELLCSR